VYHDQQGDYAALARDARRQIELESWREQAHRQLMRALAAIGDRTAALAAYERCRQVLEAELGVEPDEETRALYERISTGELSPLISRAPAPALRSPAHLTPFVGRERELAEIVARLRQADMRLLTLVGAGGMGKTRLALEVVRLQLADSSSDQPDQLVEPARLTFPDGVFFVSLAPLTTTAAIVPSVATSIGVSLQGDPKQALLRFLRDKQLLLILDNFEHLLDGVELILEILQTAPLVKLIVTSREQLKVRGKHIYVIEGMDYQAEDTTASSAIKLFVQSARRVRADFQLSEEKLPHLLRICDLVQGMPLGIELAAAWVEMLPLEAYVAACEPNLARDDPHTAVAGIRSEIGNILQAWACAARSGRLADLDRSAYGIWQFQTVAGSLSQGAQLFGLAAEGIQNYLQQASIDESNKQYAYGVLRKMLAMRASHLLPQGSHDQSLTLAQQAIALAQQTHAGIEGAAIGYLVQGQALRRKGYSSEAHDRLIYVAQLAQQQRAAGVQHEVLPEVEWRAYNWLCSIALTQDDYGTARQYAEAGLAICRSLGKRIGEIACLTDIVDIALAVGDHEQALIHAEHAWQMAQQLAESV
jgi:Bacterial transcriptional activator domain/AAA domain